MYFFFFCTPWHKPTTYFKDACNQFDFGLILKSKDQLSTSDNSNASSTSVVSPTIFLKRAKHAIFWVSASSFSKTWRDGKFLFVFSEHLQPSYLYKKCQNFQGCVIDKYCIVKDISKNLPTWITRKIFFKSRNLI